MGRVILSSGVREHILNALQGAYPEEGCGALIGRVLDSGDIEITDAAALPNAEPIRGEDRFQIEPRAYEALERNLAERRDGTSVLGFFHSHPDGAAHPSSIDLEAAVGLFEVAQIRYVYAIATTSSATAGELTFWRLNEECNGFERQEAS
jgi:proteasome lid subunit RPN8/RPN11